MPDSRPDPETVADRPTLERWYWTKAELVEMARQHALPRSGSKTELSERIGHFLETGERRPIARSCPRGPRKVDWRRDALTGDTVIDAHYRNTQHVRAFFVEHCGERFRFSNEFMQWMRDQVGGTLADAVAFWRQLDRRKREEGYREVPLPQNQFNAFTRALSQAVPGISSSEIRRLWAVKRAGPAPHVYRPGDEDA